MSWLDKLLAEFDRAPDPAPAALEGSPPDLPARQRQDGPEIILSTWVQTRAPRDAGDPGACEPVWYSVVDGVVMLTDESGKPTGDKHPLSPGDDASQVAGRLALAAIKKAWGETDFNRPLGYQRIGIA